MAAPHGRCIHQPPLVHAAPRAYSEIDSTGNGREPIYWSVRRITEDRDETEQLEKTFGKYSDCWTNNSGMAQVAKRHVQ